MLTLLKNNTIHRNKYHGHPEAIIISCFFNPQNSAYRLHAFEHFYNSIKHLNHRIIECVIGDSQPQLTENNNIQRIYTENLLWHKESLLNKIISELPSKYKYIFWVDADVIFTNLKWLTSSIDRLQTSNILQPFEYCVHLKKDELEPSSHIPHIYLPNTVNKMVWRSFCANHHLNKIGDSQDYNTHGHVGFAWGARREVLDQVPLYDRALIGGADHIIAHAAAGQIGHSCITKSFTENIKEVNIWSQEFYKVVKGKISYVPGDLYHIWHGDIDNRQYLRRIIDFTPKTKQITNKDKNGLYITHKGDDAYMRDYFRQREVTNNSFLNSVAIDYTTDNALTDANLLNIVVEDVPDNQQFGGGDFGGSGAGSDWSDQRFS